MGLLVFTHPSCGSWHVTSALSLSLSQTFLGYTDAGAQFVFGEKYTDHFFAFKVSPDSFFSMPAYQNEKNPNAQAQRVSKGLYY